jgi:hypothetical protein
VVEGEAEAEAVVVGEDVVPLEPGVERVAGVPDEVDELAVVEACTKLNKSFTTLLTSFCRLEVAAVVVSEDVVELDMGVEAAIVIGASAELGVVDVPEEPDELPALEADSKLKRSFTTLLTPFCTLDVVPPPVAEPAVSSALE